MVSAVALARIASVLSPPSAPEPESGARAGAAGAVLVVLVDADAEVVALAARAGAEGDCAAADLVSLPPQAAVRAAAVHSRTADAIRRVVFMKVFPPQVLLRACAAQASHDHMCTSCDPTDGS